MQCMCAYGCHALKSMCMIEEQLQSACHTY